MTRGIFTFATPTAAELNDCFDPPRCRVYNNANIAITTATYTLLTFNSEYYDVGAMHSTSSNTGRITIPSGGAGTYLVTGHVTWAANTTGVREIYVTQNGRAMTDDFNRNPISDVATNAVTTLIQCQDGDILELYCYQTSGGNLNVTYLADRSPTFSACWMSV